MKSIPKLFGDWFSPKEIYGIDISEIQLAFSDSVVRNIWLLGIYEELKRLNLEIDKRLLMNDSMDITDLAARRKAHQDVLESVLTARRRAKGSNPPSKDFDLDSVTVLPAPE